MATKFTPKTQPAARQRAPQPPADDPADLEAGPQGEPGVDVSEPGVDVSSEEQGEEYDGEGEGQEGQEQRPEGKKKLNGELVYREGDNFAVFLRTNPGPNGPWQSYEIVDGPKGSPDTQYFSLPAKVNGVMLEASEHDRGGEVARLFAAQQIMLEKKLQRPYRDEQTGEMVTHSPFLVECKLVQTEKDGKTFNKLQPYVAYPVFRKEERDNPNARPIGYRIPKEDTAGSSQQQQKQEGDKEDRYVLVWRKQGEMGGKNIYITIPEAFDLRDGKSVSREGVKIDRIGIKNGVLETSAVVQGSSQRQGFSRRYDQSAGRATAARSSAPRYSAPPRQDADEASEAVEAPSKAPQEPKQQQPKQAAPAPKQGAAPAPKQPQEGARKGGFRR